MENGEDARENGQSGNRSEFSWYAEIQKKQKLIDNLIANGKRKTAKVKQLERELADLKASMGTNTAATESKGGGESATGEGEGKKKLSNKEKYLPHDYRYWL